jgi:hypothetical protein
MDCKKCDRCGAEWHKVNGNWEHRWLSGFDRGTPASRELDLAAKICRPVSSPACINPSKDKEGGRGWDTEVVHMQLMGLQMQDALKNKAETARRIAAQKPAC